MMKPIAQHNRYAIARPAGQSRNFILRDSLVVKQLDLRAVVSFHPRGRIADVQGTATRRTGLSCPNVQQAGLSGAGDDASSSLIVRTRCDVRVVDPSGLRRRQPLPPTFLPKRRP